MFKTSTLFTSVKNTTQRLEEETLDRVRDHGKMGESFNVVINKVLDQIEDLKERLDEHDEDLNQLEAKQENPDEDD